MKTIQLIEFLSTSSDLSDVLSDEEIIAFAPNLGLKTVSADTVLRKEGEPDCSLLIVVSGEVRLSHDGNEITKLHPGQIFGEGVFSEDGTSFEQATCTVDSVVARLALKNFEKFLQTDAKAAQKLKEHYKNLHHQRLHEVEGLSFRDQRKFLALVAHNEMKPSLMEFAKSHQDKLRRFHLIATGTTGIKLYQETGLMLSKKVASGPLGGDQAIGKMISESSILGMIFFRDPLSAHPHHADIEALGRLCDVYQVPFATNPGGAAAILNHLLVDHPEEAVIPNRVLEHYRNQQKKVVSAP
jgi:methylglyoxal synthase